MFSSDMGSFVDLAWNQGLAKKPGARTLTVRVRFWPKLLSIAVVELGLPLLWGLDHADGRDCSDGFLLGNFFTFFSLARRRRNPLKFELHLMHLVRSPRELRAILTRSSSILSNWSAE